jgi:Chromo (CHRromatin Organisation MOdifier) domain
MSNRALQDRSFDTGWARLRLSLKSYSLPSIRKFTLSPRYTRAFKILETLGRGNALRLDLPASWGIHPVISKIHLDPAPNPDDDPYHRNVPPPPDHIDEQGVYHWKVEKVVGKLVSASGEAILYKLRWQGWREESDSWEDSSALDQAQEAVQAYEDALQRSGLRGRRQKNGTVEYKEPAGRRRARPNQAI